MRSPGPLRAEGEHVYQVPLLDVPAEDNLDMKDVLEHGAVKLFIARAHAAEPRYVPDIRLAAVKAGICRHLDGIPLAIELAATRVASFGVEGVAACLEDRFRLLTGGNRTALPRHQTMRAALDWSYELLSDPLRVILRRLAVFAGGFTLESASAVTRGALPVVVDCPVANLVARSLIAIEHTLEMTPCSALVSQIVQRRAHYSIVDKEIRRVGPGRGKVGETLCEPQRGPICADVVLTSP